MNTKPNKMQKIAARAAAALVPVIEGQITGERAQKRLQYVVDDLCQLQPKHKERRRKLGLLSNNEVAKKLHVAGNHLYLLRATGKIPQPTHVCGKRSYYSENDLPMLRAALDEWIEVRDSYYDIRRKAGWLSTLEVAEMCRVRPITIQHHQRAGHIPYPLHKVEIDGKKYPHTYYTREEAEAIVEWHKENRQPRRPSLKYA
jgi:hypothetical protein